MTTRHQPPYNNFLRRLADARKKHGLTQADLARQLGEVQSYVAKVETAQRRLDVEEFVRWTRAIGLDPSQEIKALDDAIQGATAVSTVRRKFPSDVPPKLR